jgi:hypothetical protein
MIHPWLQCKIDVKAVCIFPAAFVVINPDVKYQIFRGGIENVHFKKPVFGPISPYLLKGNSGIMAWGKR